MNAFKKFTSIEKFSDVWQKMQKYDTGILDFRSKIKLHGTNAGVRIVDGKVTAQKRTSDVTPMADNAGFAMWVSNVDWKTDKDIIIYGEWAGPGVQKSDAVSLIPHKMFFPFGVLLLDVENTSENPGMNYVIDPELIADYVPADSKIMVIPWFDDKSIVNSDISDTARELQKKLEDQIIKIGEEDPFIAEKFDVSGSGEGLVVGPTNDSGIVNIDHFNTFVFKVKTEAHMVQKTKSPAGFKVEVPDSVKSFAKTFVTEARCQQMIDEHCDGSMSPKMIGIFLKNLNADILKESTNELAGLDIEWKIVAKEINKIALKWFQDKNKI